MQRKECEIVPAKVKARIKRDLNDEGDPGEIALSIDGEGWYRRVNPKDFSFLVSGKEGVFKVVPDHFTEEGAPVYSRRSWEKLPLGDINVEEIYPVLDTNVALAVGRGAELPAPFEGPEEFKKWFLLLIHARERCYGSIRLLIIKYMVLILRRCLLLDCLSGLLVFVVLSRIVGMRLRYFWYEVIWGKTIGLRQMVCLYPLF